MGHNTSILSVSRALDSLPLTGLSCCWDPQATRLSACRSANEKCTGHQDLGAWCKQKRLRDSINGSINAKVAAVAVAVVIAVVSALYGAVSTPTA